MARNTAEDRRSLTLSFQNTSTKIKLYNRKPFKLPDEGVLLCFCILLSEKKKAMERKNISNHILSDLQITIFQTQYMHVYLNHL